ncbi:hypothetical protein CDD82_2551 [Ophiocordyceps australis]|uniref:Transaldolase n=1 Tax=Ophiocordyceps australis TaxID=1399860 RepID=A0A2C5XUJ7_9HYPO|nr:hypothetical protein CDD82_2551 [Ophiocordyceps australis]
MASQDAAPVSILDYLRSKTSIDYDSLDLDGRKNLSSGLWEAYLQLSNPQNAVVVQESVELAHKLEREFGGVSVNELAVEIAMNKLALRVIPLISGSIHVMCNPLYAWDSEKVYETGHRFHKICRLLEPDFDLSRLVMKVPSTWHGLQACKRLKTDNIKTLATTLFTMEQVVLAGEVGCTYHDPAPIHALVAQAQRYYKDHNVPTKVKACAFMTTSEIISFAGVDAMTIPAETLQDLASTHAPPGIESQSVFAGDKNGLKRSERLSFVDDGQKFLRAFATNGRGKAKTEDAIAVFCGFQVEAEALVASVQV